MGFAVFTSRYGRVRKMTARAEAYCDSIQISWRIKSSKMALAQFYLSSLTEAEDLRLYKEWLAEGGYESSD